MQLSRSILLAASAIALLGVGACSAPKTSVPSEAAALTRRMADPVMLARAWEVMDSVYSHYGIADSHLLRENHPYDQSFKAGYLAGDDGHKGNPYSYLWPFSGSVSAQRAILEASGDHSVIKTIDNHVIPGLQCYYDTLRAPRAYASYVNGAPQSDRFYDDNVWLGIDFSELYLLTNRQDYLDRAREIWKFIESGTDTILGGGIYWCEQKKHSKNTCSNAPGAVFALRLHQATGNPTYLKAARELYHWTKTTLQDPEDYLYWDNKGLNGKIGRAKFAYNSGQMLQAAVLLYKATGDQAYLTDAQNIAQAAFRHFFSGGTATDSRGDFPLLTKGNVWFTAIMMRGYKELYLVDNNPVYMDTFVRNLNHAWTTMKDPTTGLFNEDWSGSEKLSRKWLLTQCAIAEMLATAANFVNQPNTKR